MRTRGHSRAAEAAIAAFSRLGEHGLGWHVVALAGAALDRSRRRLYLRAMRATAAAFLANQLVKVTVRRARPEIEGLPPLTNTLTRLSYPSAHATTSFAAAATLPFPAVPVHAAAAALTLSRLYLGVHYPSDLIAGAALGRAVAALTP